ncbi:MAG TPA: hypothetical protein VGX51_00940 [Solirubrobacteraceae bacterium]|jgi:hypothetical protein|nr:hypothetical protein [Solirubrobacteraceae bacterium]
MRRARRSRLSTWVFASAVMLAVATPPAVSVASASHSSKRHHGRHARHVVARKRVPPVTEPAFNCQVFPSNNPLNEEIANAPVDPNSANYVASIGLSAHLHPDFGTNPTYGIPYAVVGPEQPQVPIAFTEFGEESDPGPYPVPPSAPIEGGGGNGDRHVLVAQEGSCTLYEMYHAHKRHGKHGGWRAGSGAVWHLNSNALRPEGWTSADAAGLPIFPLLVRHPEVAGGHIEHALRVTVPQTQRGYIHPATHFASSSTDPNLPPMGLRLRLKASYPLAGFSGEALVVLEALKRYGLIVADNGSPWFITGAPDTRWNDETLNELKSVPGSEFEAVESGSIIH